MPSTTVQMSGVVSPSVVSTFCETVSCPSAGTSCAYLNSIDSIFAPLVGFVIVFCIADFVESSKVARPVTLAYSSDRSNSPPH